MVEKFLARRITIREDQASWLDNHPEISLSGLVQRAIDDYNVRFGERMIDDTGVKMDYVCVKILSAMTGSAMMETDTILSRVFPQGDQHLDVSELQDRLKIMENKWGYVKTCTKDSVGGNGIYKAGLTELGRQFLREKEGIHSF